jgi:hypothetical protein
MKEQCFLVQVPIGLVRDLAGRNFDELVNTDTGESGGVSYALKHPLRLVRLSGTELELRRAL